MNNTLWELAELKEEDYSDFHSIHDYLVSKGGFSEEMMAMAAGGFSNTLCTNSKDLSLKQCIKWSRLWHDCEGEDGDFMFEGSFKVLVDHLKKNLQVETGSPVVFIQTPEEDKDVNGGLVKLKTSTGVTYYARSLVITSSPYVLKSGIMKFQPDLTEELKASIDTVNMHSIVKVFLKFSEPVWPKKLHGMIMTDENMLLPEIWFRDVSDKALPDEPAKAYCIGFTTADYAARLAALPKEEVLKRAVKQLDEVFSLLEPRHMAADLKSGNIQKPSDLKKPSEAYLGGMFWDWNPQHHPFIGGGYCSPRTNKAVHLIELMSKPYGKYICFAGEATNMPGATAHAALESGVRAADNISKAITQLKDQEKSL